MKTFSCINKICQPLKRLPIYLLAKSMIFFFFLSVVSTAVYADISIGKEKLIITLPALHTTSSFELQHELRNKFRTLTVLPEGFEVIMQGYTPCRLQGQSPFLIYSNDNRFNRVFQYAIESWNSAARKLGMAPLFAGAVSSSEADVTLDWSSKGLPQYAAGGVWWSTGEEIEIVSGITIEPNTGIPEGNLAEILMQELGHITGLGHSQDKRDIMYHGMHTNRYPSLSSVQLTQRDIQALNWLYSQHIFIPIVGIKQASP